MLKLSTTLEKSLPVESCKLIMAEVDRYGMTSMGVTVPEQFYPRTIAFYAVSSSENVPVGYQRAPAEVTQLCWLVLFTCNTN